MSVFLFPGQGSQTPGMGRDFYEGSPVAREVFDRVETLAPDGFLETVFEGPDEALAQPDMSQPALLTVEVAVARHLIDRGHEPSACAGHSFGEIAALEVAGSLEFDAAFALAQARGRCMKTDVPEGGMAAVLGLPPDEIEAALPNDAFVANYNGPGQTIISGTRVALEEAERALKAAGAKRFVALNVAGPFHTPFMEQAQTAFRKALEEVSIVRPRVPVVSSVREENLDDPEAIRAVLGEQICKPVQWTSVMHRLGNVRAFEVGPGRVLQGLAKRTEPAPRIEHAGTLEAANTLEVAS